MLNPIEAQKEATEFAHAVSESFKHGKDWLGEDNVNLLEYLLKTKFEKFRDSSRKDKWAILKKKAQQFFQKYTLTERASVINADANSLYPGMKGK